jgi:hypothetical protein
MESATKATNRERTALGKARENKRKRDRRDERCAGAGTAKL